MPAPSAPSTPDDDSDASLRHRNFFAPNRHIRRDLTFWQCARDHRWTTSPDRHVRRTLEELMAFAHETEHGSIQAILHRFAAMLAIGIRIDFAAIFNSFVNIGIILYALKFA